MMFITLVYKYYKPFTMSDDQFLQTATCGLKKMIENIDGLLNRSPEELEQHHDEDMMSNIKCDLLFIEQLEIFTKNHPEERYSLLQIKNEYESLLAKISSRVAEK